MSPEDKKLFQRIFLLIFNDEWFKGFETSVKMDEAEIEAFGEPKLAEEDVGLDGKPIDDKLFSESYAQSKAWFLTFWNLFKVECYNHKIVLERHAAKELCFTILPRPDIWEKLIDEDHEFMVFEDMRAKFEEEKAYEEALPEKQAQIARRNIIRSLVRQNFIKSADSGLPDKRLAVPFAEELGYFVEDLEKNCIQTSPNEIATVIHHVMPHVPMSLLKLIVNYKQKLEEIKAIKIEPLEEGTPELEEAELVEDEVMTTCEPEINPETNQLEMMDKQYTIGKKGLIEAFEILATQNHSPMEFYNKLKGLLDALHNHCQRSNKLAGFLKLVYQLQTHFHEKWDRKDQTPYGLKIGFIYSGLGLKHAQLAESMPSTFGKDSKFTCQ